MADWPRPKPISVHTRALPNRNRDNDVDRFCFPTSFSRFFFSTILLFFLSLVFIPAMRRFLYSVVSGQAVEENGGLAAVSYRLRKQNSFVSERSSRCALTTRCVRGDQQQQINSLCYTYVFSVGSRACSARRKRAVSLVSAFGACAAVEVVNYALSLKSESTAPARLVMAPVYFTQ